MLEGEEEAQEPVEELTEEELEAKRQEEENQKLNEDFENYSNLDAGAETKKLQEKVMAKNKRKAVSHLKEETHSLLYFKSCHDSCIYLTYLKCVCRRSTCSSQEVVLPNVASLTRAPAEVLSAARSTT